METLTATQNDEEIKQFLIAVSFTNPITKIIKGLTNGEYRDCDIKWLDNKLEAFVKTACDSLGLNITLPSQAGVKRLTVLNAHNTNNYISRFNILLEYFKHL